MTLDKRQGGTPSSQSDYVHACSTRKAERVWRRKRWFHKRHFNYEQKNEMKITVSKFLSPRPPPSAALPLPPTTRHRLFSLTHTHIHNSTSSLMKEQQNSFVDSWPVTRTARKRAHGARMQFRFYTAELNTRLKSTPRRSLPTLVKLCVYASAVQIRFRIACR